MHTGSGMPFIEDGNRMATENGYNNSTKSVELYGVKGEMLLFSSFRHKFICFM